MSSQRISLQRIDVGPIASTLGRLDLATPVMVVGSSRSTALLRAPDLLPGAVSFDGSTSHNPFSVVTAARRCADDIGARTVIAVGSASAIDLGKAVVDGHPAALVAVPTTLGGSEMTRVYGTRHDDGTKRGGAGSALLPSTVCYDPALLSTLPAQTLAASGVNAWAHAIEARYGLRQHWVGKACAVSSGRALPQLLTRAADKREREACLVDLLHAACLAGFSLNACGMGLHHAVCHVLGGITRVPHAALNVAVLPAAVQVNARLAPQAVADVERDFGVDDIGTEMAALTKLYELPASLEALGVTPEQLDAAVPAVMNAHHLGNNPCPPTEADVKDLLAAAFDGSALPI